MFLIILSVPGNHRHWNSTVLMLVPNWNWSAFSFLFTYY